MAEGLTVELFPVPVKEELFNEMVMFAIDLAADVARVEIDTEDMLIGAYHGVSEGRTWLVRRDGEMVGVCCMIERTYWYNTKRTYWSDMFFYIAPEERDGEAVIRLWRAIRNAAVAAKKHAWVQTINPRRKRGQRLIQLC